VIRDQGVDCRYPGKPRARQSPNGFFIDAAEGVDRQKCSPCHEAKPRRAESRNPDMALRREHRRQQNRIAMRTRRNTDAARRMGRARDQPGWMHPLPMRRLPRPRFRQVEPIAADPRGEVRIARDEQKKPAFMGYFAQLLRQFPTRPRFGMAQDDGSAFG